GLLSEPTKTLKIAVVDDEKDLLSTYSLVVKTLGYKEPEVFSDGTSLIRSLMNDQKSFDVILMDYRMPEMNGIEAARLIKRYRRQTQIVIMSGYDFVKEKAGAFGIPFLQKPFSIKQLGECLENLKMDDLASSQQIE
ncbi:MAG: response regulator, partial [Nitrososphaerales archaeon]